MDLDSLHTNTGTAPMCFGSSLSQERISSELSFTELTLFEVNMSQERLMTDLLRCFDLVQKILHRYLACEGSCHIGSKE